MVIDLGPEPSRGLVQDQSDQLAQRWGSVEVAMEEAEKLSPDLRKLREDNNGLWEWGGDDPLWEVYWGIALPALDDHVQDRRRAQAEAERSQAEVERARAEKAALELRVLELQRQALEEQLGVKESKTKPVPVNVLKDAVRLRVGGASYADIKSATGLSWRAATRIEKWITRGDLRLNEPDELVMSHRFRNTPDGVVIPEP